MSLTYTNGVRHSQNEALIAFAGSNALIHIYTGPQPTSANDAITSQTLLASLPVVGAFGVDVNGTLTLNPVTSALATASGVAAFFRVTKSNGTTVVMDGSIGLSNADLLFNDVNILELQTIGISSGTIIRNNQ
jgi:hypothetical protein